MRALALAAAVYAGVASNALAQKEYETLPAANAAQPAVGAWNGGVSWNAPIVQYGWTLYPDGTFTSGRSGRGETAGGDWGTHGAHLTLKYTDGFRYEGDLKDGSYIGAAYTSNRQLFGSFRMSRDVKNFDTPGNDGD